jgi:hypothetical protein
MFSFLKVPAVSKELLEFTEEMTKTVGALKNQSTAFVELSSSILALIDSEAPSFIKYFEHISEIYTRLSYIYANGADALDRALEDFRDINARFAVVKRLEAQRNAARANYTDSCAAVDSAFSSINQEKPETKENHEKAIKKRTECMQKLIDEDKSLLECRRKFRAFSIRRIKSGWARYGEALSSIYALENASFNELAKQYKSIRDHATDPEKILSHVTRVQPEQVINEVPAVTLTEPDNFVDLDIRAPPLV